MPTAAVRQLLARIKGGKCDECDAAVRPVCDEDRSLMEEAIHSGEVVRVDRLCDDCGGVGADRPSTMPRVDEAEPGDETALDVLIAKLESGPCEICTALAGSASLAVRRQVEHELRTRWRNGQIVSMRRLCTTCERLPPHGYA